MRKQSGQLESNKIGIYKSKCDNKKKEEPKRREKKKRRGRESDKSRQL